MVYTSSSNIVSFAMYGHFQVRFVPSQQSKLISSSVDGLMCLFDTDGQIDDDDHLESVSSCFMLCL